MRVQLGNAAPHEVIEHAEAERRGLTVDDHDSFDEGRIIVPIDTEDAVTAVDIPGDRSLSAAFVEVTHMWAYHSTEPAAWVASDSEGLAALLAEQYGCEIRELEEAADAD